MVLLWAFIASLLVTCPLLEDAPLIATADVTLVPLNCKLHITWSKPHAPTAGFCVRLVMGERLANPILIRVL